MGRNIPRSENLNQIQQGGYLKGEQTEKVPNGQSEHNGACKKKEAIHNWDKGQNRALIQELLLSAVTRKDRKQNFHHSPEIFTQSAGAVEYTNCFSAEGQDSSPN